MTGMEHPALDPDLTAVVCPRLTGTLTLPDNQTGVCRVCESLVEHRPHIPTPSQLVCLACYARLASPDDDIYITKRSIQEVAQWMKDHP
jgi:hypothetical protein